MTIWVDADSCPQAAREIIARAAVRRGIETIFVANRNIPIPEEELLSMVIVEQGEGVADRHIIDSISEGDLAVTRDIPLAAELVELKAAVVNDRGAEFTPENIRERLSVRDLMKDFRDIGIMPERESSYGPREIQKFANALDRTLTKLLKD